ncbi:undecaprenyldiphospho-muramoylpentapeptide beta-N-acetylglucosaminyltransferase [bacterium]|nr:undecaprenyldiphospho-muramoylpentapeptide beta-N-acetylglucosaminyltransferase [bacterium]
MSDTSKGNKKYTYFITGGGTGGHIYPAMAVCEALKNDEETKDIFYIGNPKNLEYDIVKKAGFKFLPIKVSAMPRRLSFGLVKWAFELELANWKALFYLLKYKPDSILGTGGYVSAPTLFAASIIKKPFMIHDCDIHPGVVTKSVAPLAKAVSLAFEDSQQFINARKFFINGNPIRKTFKELSKVDARLNLGLENKKTICIMGGSQGAKSINNAAVEILKDLSQKYNVQVIFQTGKKNYDNCIQKLKELYPEYENDKNLIVKPYFDDMATVLKASDIAVSRAGSLSLSEICACGIAPILVPYPFAAADHQRKNAKAMLHKEACIYIEDADVNPQSLMKFLSFLIENPDKLDLLQTNTRKLAKYDSTERIVRQLKSIAKWKIKRTKKR